MIEGNKNNKLQLPFQGISSLCQSLMDHKYSLSIDEQSVPNRSIDVASATRNLQCLQHHIHVKFQNPELAPATNRMASGQPFSPSTYQGSGIGRQDSVNEEDLFGPGASPNIDEAGMNEMECAGLPHFSLMGLDSIGYQGDGNGAKAMINVQKDAEEIEENENLNEEAGENVDVKTTKMKAGSFKPHINAHFFDKRSISQVGMEKMKNFRIRSDEEVICDPDVVNSDAVAGKQPVRKSKSLPDLILSSSSLSPRCISDVPGGYNSSPDVTLPILTEATDPVLNDDVFKKKRIKDHIEGPTSYNRKTLLRSVSFDTNGPQVINREIPEADEYDEKSPMTPQSPADGKRQRFSDSSGYVTGGSKESRDTNAGSSMQSQTSQSSSMENENDETEKEMFIPPGLLNIPSCLLNIPSGSSDSSGSYSGSMHTVVSAGSAKYDMQEQKNLSSGNTGSGDDPEIEAKISPTLDLPLLSILNQGSFGPLIIEPVSEGQEVCTARADKGTVLPADDSFSLGKSMMAKVDEEDDKCLNFVRRRYVSGTSGERSMIGGQPSMASQGSYQPGSGSLNQCGLDSRSAMVVRQWEQILQTDASPATLLHCLQNITFSDSSSPSPSSYTVDGGRKVKTPSSPKHGTFTLVELERSSRCTMRGCRELCCVKLAEVEQILRDIPEADPSYDLLKHYCVSLYDHSAICEELSCSVLYCPLVGSWGLDKCNIDTLVKQMVTEIQRIIVEPVMSSLPYPDGTFHKLQNSCPCSPPKDLETHLPMSRLGKFGAAILCLQITSNTLCVQQKYPQLDYKHQLSVYTARLKNLRHPHIVPQLWLMEYDDEAIQVCSLFMQGGSLEDYLSSEDCLPWSLTVQYMQQILSAVSHLHEKGVVYLYWHSANMLFTDSHRQTIKVGNFSLSYPLGTQSDLGATKACLPYNLCPPELLTNQNKIDFKSDSWGTGCLLAELLSGKPVWHDLRHENMDTVHGKIRNHFPNVENVTLTKEQRTVLHDYCWQQQPGRRKSVQELFSFFSSLKTTSENR